MLSCELLVKAIKAQRGQDGKCFAYLRFLEPFTAQNIFIFKDMVKIYIEICVFSASINKSMEIRISLKFIFSERMIAMIGSAKKRKRFVGY